MSRLVKIVPIKKQYLNAEFFEGSLASHGYTRIPGTFVRVCPVKDISGKYKTGLDEDARDLEALKVLDKKEYDAEVKRIKTQKEELERLTSKDLSPTSDYYKSISENGGVPLGDEPLVLNLDSPEDMITYLWIKNHPKIAPSFEQWQLGGETITPDMEFYIADEVEDVKVQFKNKQKINKLIQKIDTTPDLMRLKWAKLLGLRVNDFSTAEEVYNVLDSYIKEGTSGNSQQNAIKEFERVSQLTDDIVDIKVTIKDAYTYNVIRSAQGGAVMFGNDKVASSMADFEDYLLDSKNSEFFINLKGAIKDKKKQLKTRA